MTAQELGLDYFKFYDVPNQQAGYVVALQGQFDRQPERVQCTYLDFFANPASKNGEPMVDKNAHLTWYDLYDPSPDPIRLVTYENQWGKAQLYTGRSAALLVPTQKNFPGSQFPEKLDHYKVYQVLRGEPVAKEVTLEDQFGKSETRVYDPVMFAVPVRKWWQGETSQINNSKAHLVIYRIYPRSWQKTVQTMDQFGRRVLQVYRSVLLAAPTTKLEWKVVD